MTVYIIVSDSRKGESDIVSVHSTAGCAAAKMEKIAQGIRDGDFCDGEIYTTENHYYTIKKNVDED